MQAAAGTDRRIYEGGGVLCEGVHVTGALELPESAPTRSFVVSATAVVTVDLLRQCSERLALVVDIAVQVAPHAALVACEAAAADWKHI